jgi:hypothetical protein
VASLDREASLPSPKTGVEEVLAMRGRATALDLRSVDTRGRFVCIVPIPDFQVLMRPLLEEYASGAERPTGEVRSSLAARFGLTEDELAERLPSGLAKDLRQPGRMGYYIPVPGWSSG